MHAASGRRCKEELMLLIWICDAISFGSAASMLLCQRWEGPCMFADLHDLVRHEGPESSIQLVGQAGLLSLAVHISFNKKK